MKNDSSYVLLAILIVILAGFFYGPNLTGEQIYNPIPQTNYGFPTFIQPISDLNESGLRLTTGYCPPGYNSAGSAVVRDVWGAKIFNPQNQTDYRYLGFYTGEGDIYFCTPSGSGALFLTTINSCPGGYISIGSISRTGNKLFVPGSAVYLCSNLTAGNPQVRLVSLASPYPQTCPTGYYSSGILGSGGYFISSFYGLSGLLGVSYNQVCAMRYSTIGTSSVVAPTATCTDGIQNQDETGIDCGGSICIARCGNGNGCNLNSDCISGTSCVNNICSTPFQSHCSNGIADADETDVDCGGSGCGGCLFNQTCSATIGSGCVSGLTCSNGRCKKIAGQSCTSSSECVSGLSCVNGVCNTTTVAIATGETLPLVPIIVPAGPADVAPSQTNQTTTTTTPTISTGGGGGGGGGRRVGAGAFICSNNRLDFGEECDDGNIFSDDGCTAECKIEYCGDGIIQYGVKEECDPPDEITCALGCTLVAEKPSIPITKPAVQEPVYQPPIVPAYEPVKESKLGSVAKIAGIIIAVAALGSLVTWIIRKKFKRQQQPYVLPVRYSRGSK